MKPESNSLTLLSITQAKAKMYEYGVPLEDHITIYRDPARLFPLSIGLLGDVAAQMIRGGNAGDRLSELRQSLPFSARFFDAYIQAKFNPNEVNYFYLIGSAAYYLSDMPGSADILSKKINGATLNLGAFGLENLLHKLLLAEESNALSYIHSSPYRDWVREINTTFFQFRKTGQGFSNVQEAANAMRAYSYNDGSPLELLVSDLIGAILRKRYENSTWTCLPQYTDLSEALWSHVIQKDTFIKEFWPSQHLLGQKGILRGKSGIVQMPTSAGKTKATEIILRSGFLAQRITLAVIIAPFRALCHEIRQDLIKAFKGEAIYVDELSDVLQKDYSIERILRDQQVLIATPEKFNYVLRHAPELAEKIGLIVYDEGHQFDNGSRGITYELLLTSLKARIPDNTQVVLISAVISNADQIGNWLIGEEKEIVHGLDLSTTFRSIGFTTFKDPGRDIYFVSPQDPDEEEFFVPRIFTQQKLKYTIRFPKFDGQDLALYLGFRLVQGGSVAIFSGTKDSVRAMCETASKVFRNGLNAKKPAETADQVEVQKLVFLIEANLGKKPIISRSARLGVFSHHNNIPHGIRLAIEYAMKKGMIKFVICTSTLAQGVNLPIRYLIVTGVYQGQEQIKVRDFQNLIGRSGRSGMHTEGSILFADPAVYDERRNWDKVKVLLDPSKSEKCNSQLLLLFDPIYSNYRKFEIELDLGRLIESYMQGQQEVASWVDDMLLSFGQVGADIRAGTIQQQITTKFNTIRAVESYLMSHADPEQPEYGQENVISLAKGTLAHFLANETQKKQIEDLFWVLAQNIQTRIPDVKTRIAFGKTMYGVPDSLVISNWLIEHAANIPSEYTHQQLFEFFWPIIAINVHNPNFSKCNTPSALAVLGNSWIQGKTFELLYKEFIESGAKYMAGTQLWSYKIEDVIDICENGLAYHGILMLSAIIELIPSLEIEEGDGLIDAIRILQKKIKYGLPDQMAIMLYELGFADRVVAIELSTLLIDIPVEKDIVVHSLKAKQAEVFQKLNLYPSYFSEVYKNQVALS
jgi:superfamily II DNA/RNA helicase